MALTYVYQATVRTVAESPGGGTEAVGDVRLPPDQSVLVKALHHISRGS